MTTGPGDGGAGTGPGGGGPPKVAQIWDVLVDAVWALRITVRYLLAGRSQ
jgi:hypothetical protein